MGKNYEGSKIIEKQYIRIGQMLCGYCGGYFGRDSYGPKRIEAFGVDWIVVREDDGKPNFATGDIDFIVSLSEKKQDTDE